MASFFFFCLHSIFILHLLVSRKIFEDYLLEIEKIKIMVQTQFFVFIQKKLSLDHNFYFSNSSRRYELIIHKNLMRN